MLVADNRRFIFCFVLVSLLFFGCVKTSHEHKTYIFGICATKLPLSRAIRPKAYCKHGKPAKECLFRLVRAYILHIVDFWNWNHCSRAKAYTVYAFAYVIIINKWIYTLALNDVHGEITIVRFAMHNVIGLL